jgi:hypothetical protein
VESFATVPGLTLTALAKSALGSKQSARAVMKDLPAIAATLVKSAGRALRACGAERRARAPSV